MDKSVRENYKSVMRMNLLKMMDVYVREVIGDDDVTNYWLYVGVADGDAETIEGGLDMYVNDDNFLDCVKAFRTCVVSEIDG